MKSDALEPIAKTNPLHGELVDQWNRTGRPTTLAHTSGKFYSVSLEWSMEYQSNQPRFSEMPTIVSAPYELPNALQGMPSTHVDHPDTAIHIPAEPGPEPEPEPEPEPIEPAKPVQSPKLSKKKSS